MRTVRRVLVRLVPVPVLMVLVLMVLVSGATSVFGQDTALHTRVMTAVRTAMRPALPFPDTDESGSVPKDNNTEAPWMVRTPEAGEASFEILANPLNEVNQLRATRAMAQIDNNIAAAQRKAEAQYERALAEAKRTGKSQDVDGVTLADEGVAGAKIDADSHVIVEVLINEPQYKFSIAGRIQPGLVATSPVPGAVVLDVPAHVYREQPNGGDERYCERQIAVFLGSVAAPQVTWRGDAVSEVTATTSPSPRPVSSLVIRLRGNDVLINELLGKTNWNGVLELLK
ncbi:MAG TPA: hypothetical protein VF491_27100 [Vicinamibacterales bacterium]